MSSQDYSQIIEGDYLNGYEKEEDDDITQELSEDEMPGGFESARELCPACSATINQDDTVCKLCGEKLLIAPPICPECFRDLKPHWTECPHCKTSLHNIKAKVWIQDKYKSARSFLEENIINLTKKFKQSDDIIEKEYDDIER